MSPKYQSVGGDAPAGGEEGLEPDSIEEIISSQN